MTDNGYRNLLKNGGLQAFLWTQFLGAFNDNVYKMIVSVGAVELAANQAMGSRYLALAGAIFVIPYLLFAGYAGQIADRFSKTKVLQYTKAFEIVIMLAGMAALYARSVEMLLVVLFLLALQSNMFSPAKYGILPEILEETQISRANGLLEFSTFAAIILGTTVGTMLFAYLKHEPLVMGGVLLGIAVAGSLTSLFIPKVAASGAKEEFHWNPLQEVWTGTLKMASVRPLWLTVAGISYFWFMGALFQLAVILLGSETLHLSETQTGLLVAALAVGIGLGSIAAGMLSGDHIEIGLVPCGALLLAITSIGAGMASGYWPVAIWLTAAGFAAGLFIVPLNAYLQEAAGAKEKGRLLATNGFLNALGILLASGVLYLLHDVLRWTPSTILIAVGFLTLVATVIIAWLVPAAMVRFVIWAGSRIFFRVKVVGAENIPQSGGALIVANHVSYADAVLLGAAVQRELRFLMFQPLYENPFLRPICKLFHAIPVAQGSAKEALRPLRTARQVIEGGELVCIFPEGQLTPTGQVLPFQRGVEVILKGQEAPVVPVYIDGLWGHALSLKGGKVFASRFTLRHRVTIVIGQPVSASLSAAELQETVMALGPQAAEVGRDAEETLSRKFVEVAKRNWSAPAVADSTGKQLTYGETLTASLLVSDWLKANVKEQHVGVVLPASGCGALVNLGVTLADKIAVNLNFTAGDAHLQYAVAKCGIGTIVTSRAFLTKTKLPEQPGMVFVEDMLAGFTQTRKVMTMLRARFLPVRVLGGRAKADDVAAVIFSSGSTGTPKGVMLSHWNLLSNAKAGAEVYSVGKQDCILGALPFFHSFGYTYTLWFPLLHGFRTVFHSNPMDAKTIGELAAVHRPTLFLSTPTFCQTYLRKCTPEQFRSIQHLLVGAEKLQPALAAAFEERFGIQMSEGYGCTEMGPAVAVNVAHADPQRHARKAGSVGRPLPRVAVKVVDPETFELLVPGQTGLLLVNGPSRMLGYLGAERSDERWYNTGDLAYVDADGFLFVVDRLTRFSKIAGEMVPHLKIEEALRAVFVDADVAVTAIPDEKRGERLVVLHTSASLEVGTMICALEEAGLPALWIPKRDSFCRVPTIPMLGSGKVDLKALKAIALEQLRMVAA